MRNVLSHDIYYYLGPINLELKKSNPIKMDSQYVYGKSICWPVMSKMYPANCRAELDCHYIKIEKAVPHTGTIQTEEIVDELLRAGNSQNLEMLLACLKEIFSHNTAELYGCHITLFPELVSEVDYKHRPFNSAEMLDILENNNYKANLLLLSEAYYNRLNDYISDNNEVKSCSVFGINGLHIFGVNIIPIKTTDNKAYLIDTDYFSCQQLSDWTWLCDDRKNIVKMSPKEDSFTVSMLKYAKVICKRPDRQKCFVFDK